MTIDWKDVVGYEDYFKVSSCGKVWSKRTSKVLKQTIGKSGYCTISTKIGGRSGESLCFRVHRLVAEAFLPKPSDELLESASSTVYGKVLVNHKDCNKSNNDSDNLEWCDSNYNIRHAIENGLLKGDTRFRDVTDEQIDYILEKYSPGSHSTGMRQISRNLGICRTTVKRVIQRRGRYV